MTDKAQPKPDDVYREARNAIEGRTGDADKAGSAARSRPAAGPHASPKQTNGAATPGSGALPSSEEKDIDASTG